MTHDGVVLVIDTNIVLDLFVFDDPRWTALHQALQRADTRWLATDAMREELRRVLRYPAIATWLTRTSRSAEAVITQFDTHATLMDEAPAAQPRCSDPDDQKFIDLAVQQRALLLSKDKAVLRLKRRLAPLGVRVAQGVPGGQVKFSHSWPPQTLPDREPGLW